MDGQNGIYSVIYRGLGVTDGIGRICESWGGVLKKKRCSRSYPRGGGPDDPVKYSAGQGNHGLGHGDSFVRRSNRGGGAGGGIYGVRSSETLGKVSASGATRYNPWPGIRLKAGGQGAFRAVLMGGRNQAGRCYDNFPGCVLQLVTGAR